MQEAKINLMDGFSLGNVNSFHFVFSFFFFRWLYHLFSFQAAISSFSRTGTTRAKSLRPAASITMGA